MVCRFISVENIFEDPVVVQTYTVGGITAKEDSEKMKVLAQSTPAVKPTSCDTDINKPLFRETDVKKGPNHDPLLGLSQFLLRMNLVCQDCQSLM